MSSCMLKKFYNFKKFCFRDGWLIVGLLFLLANIGLPQGQKKSTQKSTVPVQAKSSPMNQMIHPDSVKVKVNPDSIPPTTPFMGFDEVELVDDESVLDAAILRNENVIKNYPDDPFIATAMFQLSELYVRKARHVYRRDNIDFEKNLRLFEVGKIKHEPVLPAIKLGKAIETCYEILERFPKVPFKDRVLYRLAVCHMDEGNFEKSNKYFTRLITEYPKSEYIAEAHFRIGEYYFNKRQFDRAVEHYSHLLNSWDNLYFNMSLYKLGWSYYNIEDYVNAISTFIYLLGDIRLLEQANAKVLGKTNSDLRQEAIDYVAISFTEFGGAPEAKRFLIDKQKGAEDYNLHVFLKMGEIYQKRNYYQESIATYKAILEIWPFYQYAPVIQQKIVEAYELDMQPEKAMEERAELVQRYGPGSKWLNQYPEGEVRNDAVKQSEKALYDYATYYQSLAQEKKRKREYLIAVEKYREYLKKFPRSDKAVQVNFMLAECLFEVTEFEAAAEEYGKVLTNYGPNQHQEDAAYNRILSYYNLLDKVPSTDSLTFYLEDFLGKQKGQPEPIKVASKTQKDILQACNDFIVMLPKSERLEEVLVKFSETLYNLHQYRLAAQVYERIIQDFKNSKFYVMAYKGLAQSYLLSGEYQLASKTSEKIAQLFPDSSKLVEVAQKWISTSGFKQAESFGKNNEPLKAAASFAEVAKTTTDPEIAKISILRASAQYDSLGDFKKAVQVLENLAETKPDFKFSPEILFKAATIREREKDWSWAIIDYMKLVERYKESKLVPKAHFNAAQCYEYMEKWALAEVTFNRFLDANYPDPDYDDILSAMYKIAEMKYKQKRFQEADIAFQNVVRKFLEYRQESRPVDDYLAAKAQYMLGEIVDMQFRAVQLQDPYDKTILQKRTLFNLTLKNYSNAVKFNIADWATVSLHKIGEIYEELGTALTQIPLPDMTPEQIEEQRKSVRQSLQQEALKYYKSNVKMAEKAQLENEWTEKSRKRVQELILELRLGTPVASNLDDRSGKNAADSTGKNSNDKAPPEQRLPPNENTLLKNQPNQVNAAGNSSTNSSSVPPGNTKTEATKPENPAGGKEAKNTISKPIADKIEKTPASTSEKK